MGVWTLDATGCHPCRAVRTILWSVAGIGIVQDQRPIGPGRNVEVLTPIQGRITWILSKTEKKRAQKQKRLEALAQTPLG